MSWIWIQLRKVFQGQSANWNFSGQHVPKKGTIFQGNTEIWNDPSYSAKKLSLHCLFSPKNASLKGVTTSPCESRRIHLGQQRKGGCPRSFLKAWADIPSSNWWTMSPHMFVASTRLEPNFRWKNAGRVFWGSFYGSGEKKKQTSKENHENISTMCRFWQQLNDHPRDSTGDCGCVGIQLRTPLQKTSITDY